MISDHISDDIPPQIEILNMVIPMITSAILSQIGALQLACHQTECDVINDVKLFPMYIAGYTVANF